MTLADKALCDHPSQTLVQHDTLLTYDEESMEPIWFVCWQCDHCGAITQKPVSVEELEAGSDLPWLDQDSYEMRTRERPRGQVEISSIHFMRRALR